MKRTKTIVVVSAVLVALSLVITSSTSAEYDRESGKKRIVVSMGDSYSAGEGIPPFICDPNLTVQNRTESPDWLAHRSTKSWPGLLTLPDTGMMSDHRGENWFFVAASGAKTDDFFGRQKIEFTRDIYGLRTVNDSIQLSPQLDVFAELARQGLTVDYVTMTIGGNDADFVGIIKKAATSSSYLQPNELSDKVNKIWDKFYQKNGIGDSLKSTYTAVANRTGDQADIIVAGYPKLISPGNAWPLFNLHEANYINHQVTLFNEEIEKIVKKCAEEGIHIHFVSVEKEFSGENSFSLTDHMAYSDDPYINPVIFFSQSEDVKRGELVSAYSIHPNENGARAYARCVQAKIDELETRKKIQNAALNAEDVVNDFQNPAPFWNPDEEPENNKFYDGMWTFRLLPDGTAELIEGRVYWENRYYIHVPAEVESGGKKYKVTSIGEGIFTDHDLVYSVTIDEGVTTIRSKAFFGAGDVNGFENPHLWASIPDSVTSIAEDAFDLSNPDLEIYANPGSYARRFFERYNVSCKDPYKR